MKRDMSLIRLLLLRLEAYEMRRGAIVLFELPDDDPDKEMAFEGYTPAQVEYHADLLIEAGLIDSGRQGSMQGFMFKRLTWEGHDFVDAIRDDAIWAKTKKGVGEVGSITFDLLKDLAKGFIKTQIKDKTGVEI